MTKVIEATKGKTRDLPISSKLKAILADAGAVVGVDQVVVTSGGQCRKGECAKRTGSTRHDDGQAADLHLVDGGRMLDFTKSSDLPTMKTFVTEAARLGATGVGAGIGYMGVNTMHIGFGPRAVWGAGGRAANAPDWIKEAALTGWHGADITSSKKSGEFSGIHDVPSGLDAILDSDDEEAETDYDTASGH